MDYQFDKVIFAIVGLVFLSIFGHVIVKFSISEPKYHYSEGERIGVLRKLSKKGLIHKTFEGELMLNAGLGSVKLDTFLFSVSSESVADSLMQHIGENLKLKYDEYLIVPYSIGSNGYLIKSFEVAER